MADTKLEHVYPFLLERTIRKMKQVSTQRFRELGYGITIDQWVILKRIGDDEGLSQVEVSESTFKDPAALTRIIDQLAKRELVERRDDPNDRRRSMLHLTKAGRSLYDEMLPEVQRQRAQGRAGISEDEMNALKTILNKIYDNVHKM